MSLMQQLGEGYVWMDAKVLVADIDVDADVARGMLPPSLELADPACATVFVADYPQTAFGSVYREAAVLLHGSDEHGALLHCPWMVVDDDTALIIGRELLGFPKKLADITLEIGDDRAVGTVNRHGVEVMRIECALEPDDLEGEPVFGHRFVNACGTMIHGLDLIEVPPSGEEIHERRGGPAKVQLTTSDRDLPGQLAVAVDAGGQLVHLDFGGSAGESRVLGPADPEWAAGRLLSRTL
jgi:acetoacetate decarboxylase